VASRKEQKEALRRERLAREQAARAAQRRRQLIGYGIGGALGLAALVIVVVVLAAGAGGDGGPGGGDLYPDDVSIPDPGPLSADVERAAEAAGCELESNAAATREHLTDPNATENYRQNPPTSGRHYAIPAEDGIYDEAADKEDLVHTLEHGRVIIWFRPSIRAEARGKLKTLVDEDPFHLVLTPNDTNMAYAVAATAWNADPQPNGTGRLMGCPRFDDKVLDALRAFRDEHRDNGPETVP
jgi:hypothetical protein